MRIFKFQPRSLHSLHKWRKTFNRESPYNEMRSLSSPTAPSPNLPLSTHSVVSGIIFPEHHLNFSVHFPHFLLRITETFSRIRIKRYGASFETVAVPLLQRVVTMQYRQRGLVETEEVVITNVSAGCFRLSNKKS